jgi:superoxide dismutase, Cu-Zn family
MVRLVIAVVALLVIAPPLTAHGEVEPTAFATLRNREGTNVGRVALRETREGLLVTLDLLGAAPGPHALHIHSVGRCERPDFESAGDHFNPDERQHGFLAPNGPHAGDLPNIFVPHSGYLSVEMLAPNLRLGDGSAHALLDADGAAVVMHAGMDDQTSQPAGDAGMRLACGVVHRPPASSW